MRSIKYSLALIAMCIAQFVSAQVAEQRTRSDSFGVERVSALHAIPRGDVREPDRSAELNEYFIYAFAPLPQALPVFDDFSIDRTQHHDAQSTDPNVTLTTTVYHLVQGTSHAASLKYMIDTTYTYLVDTVHVNNVDSLVHDTIIGKVPNPWIAITVYDITTYPSTSVNDTVWPVYNVFDTVFNSNVDTLFLTPNLIQDSLLVYTVSANTDLYHNPDGSTRALILWQEDETFVNGTYGDSPPSIGVCTFDGMDRTGYPYDPVTPNNHGIADHLTSVPINLQFPTSDSLYLSFFVQPRGLSGDNQIQPEDSLILEMYAPLEQQWIEVWSYPYSDVVPFKQIMVPIKDSRFLQQQFQLRFSNKATYAGAVDQWNLDYLRIGRNRSYSDTVLQDVAFVYPANTVLDRYTSVPFAKFTQDPTSYMADTIGLFQKNLDIADKFITWGYFADQTCGGPSQQFNNYGNNIASNALTEFNSVHPINSAPNNYVFNTGSCTDAAFLHASFWTNATPDVCQYNDSTHFTQEISNYYSYDDGSAEAGYWLNTTGGKIAYRFDTEGDDTLRAVRMYFDPIFAEGDPTQGSFLITVWSALSDAGQIFQNVSFSKPAYVRWGPNHFVEYVLDSAIHVNGTFYVGWVQTNTVKMNLGLDKNRVSNDRMFYNVANAWVQSTVHGSWMMRPVMVSAVDPFATVPELEGADDAMRIWPNPANDALWIDVRDGRVVKNIEMIDATGRVVLSEAFTPDAPIGMTSLTPGLFIVRALDADRKPIAQQRVIIQR